MQILRYLFINGYVMLFATNILTLLGVTALYWPLMLGIFLTFNVLDYTLKVSKLFDPLTLDNSGWYFITWALTATIAPLAITSVPVLNILQMLTPFFVETISAVFGNPAPIPPAPHPAPAPAPVPPFWGFPVPHAPAPRNPDQALDVDDDENNHDLRNMAQRGVYGMQDHQGGHNRRQRAALDDMRAQYQAEFNRKGGTQPIIEEIKQYLRREYERNPARDAHGHALPLENLGRGAPYGFDNAPYHRHDLHTAYRYLSAPNNWIDPTHMFIERIGILGNGYKALTTPHELEKIAYMWLAANDNRRRLPDGYTREGLLNEFTIALKELGRAYNHHDNESDRPTCPNGMNQRVTQFYMVFLNDRPETRPLTADIIYQKFQQEMLNESPIPVSMFNKVRALDRATLTTLNEALEKKYVLFDELTPEETNIVDRFVFSEADATAFVDVCKNYFSPNRITQIHAENNRIAFQAHRFNSYEAMIRHLAQDTPTLFYQHMKRNVEQHLAQMPDEAPAQEAPLRRRRRPGHAAV